MNLNILSQNLVIYICVIFSILGFWELTNLYNLMPNPKPRGKKAKLQYKKINIYTFASVIPFSILLGLLLKLFIGSYTNSPLPVSFILMCLPFCISLGLLLIAFFIKKKLKAVAAVCTVIGLIFSLILINDYYRYDSTLAYVFDNSNTKTLNDPKKDITVSYTSRPDLKELNNNSLQESISRLRNSSTSGTVYSINIPGKISKFDTRTSYVYLPAIYNKVPQIKLPVIVLLPGTPGIPLNWLSTGLESIMDNFAAGHGGITPIVVVADEDGTVNNDTECVNSPRGNVETYLTQDVPNYIKQHFRVETSSSNWAIGGLSLGGMCGIMLSLTHPNIYKYFIDLGGDIGPSIGTEQQTVDTLFAGNQIAYQEHQPVYLLAHNKYPGSGGFFGDGDQDYPGVRTAITQLSADTKKDGLDTISVLVHGAHTFDVWGETYTDALPWISNRLGATECTGSCI